MAQNPIVTIEMEDGGVIKAELYPQTAPNTVNNFISLIQKGYVEKIRSDQDRREYHLRPTQKYIDYYNISYSYLHTVVERARQRFTPEECAKLEQMLTIVSSELMPELDILKKGEN